MFAFLDRDGRKEHPSGAAMRFVRSERYSAGAALGFTLGRIPGVLVAVRLVRSLPVDIVRRDSSNLPARHDARATRRQARYQTPLIAGAHMRHFRGSA